MPIKSPTEFRPKGFADAMGFMAFMHSIPYVHNNKDVDWSQLSPEDQHEWKIQLRNFTVPQVKNATMSM